MAGAWRSVMWEDPSVHMYECWLLIGFPKGLNKIFWEVSDRQKRC